MSLQEKVVSYKMYFTKEFKMESVKMVMESGLSLIKAFRRFSDPESMFRNCVKSKGAKSIGKWL